MRWRPICWCSEPGGLAPGIYHYLPTYLSAADLGLGAFVTAAINDGEAESALGLAPLREAAIAIVGFGSRAETRTNVELDDVVPTPAALIAAVD